MKLSEYSDDEILDEVQHRGFEIEIVTWKASRIKIGGIAFDIE